MIFKFFKRLFFSVPKRPSKIQIEITNKCNLDCFMCPRKDFNLEYEDMDFATLKRIAEKIPAGSEITLTGWGEPLLYSRIHEAIRIFKRKKCLVELTTNATLLNQEMIEKLVNDELDSISLSVDSFEELASQDPRHHSHSIKSVVQNLISSRQNKKPLVILQPTLHKGKEGELLELIKKGKELGVDRINIARLDRRFNKNLPSFRAEEEFELAEKIMTFSDKLKIRVDFLPFSAFTGIKRRLFILFGRRLFRKNRPCPKLYDYVYITHSGKATPCCSLPTYELGDLLSQSLEEVWNGEKFRKFRKNSNLVCDGCEMLRLPEC